MKMNREQKKNLAKQIAINTALAGVGTGAGYFAGGALAKGLASSHKFKTLYASLSPARKKALLATLKYGGTIAGTAAGGLASYNLTRKMQDSTEEKVANLCTIIYRGHV